MGFGKSLTYRALPLICSTVHGTTGHIVVVVSPLVNLMKDQATNLANIGIPAVTLSDFLFYCLLKKYTQISHIGVWCATHDLGGITFHKKGNGLCFQRML